MNGTYGDVYTQNPCLQHTHTIFTIIIYVQYMEKLMHVCVEQNMQQLRKCTICWIIGISKHKEFQNNRAISGNKCWTVILMKSKTILISDDDDNDMQSFSSESNDKTKAPYQR